MYQLPSLKYLYQDLEPFIDTHTMSLHYEKHTKNYLNKLNSLLEKHNYNYKYSLTELVYHLDEFDKTIREDILTVNLTKLWIRRVPSKITRKKSGKSYFILIGMQKRGIYETGFGK